MSVKIILSKHWMESWKERISAEELDYRHICSLIAMAIAGGNTRIRRDLSLGVMVKIEWKGKPAYVIGSFNERKEYIAKTVLDDRRASVMGWKRRSEGPKTSMKEVLKCAMK